MELVCSICMGDSSKKVMGLQCCISAYICYRLVSTHTTISSMHLINPNNFFELMMKEKSSDPASVRGSQFMQADAANFIFQTSSTEEQLITDVNNNPIFKVNPYHTNHQQFVVVDSNNRIIALLRKKKRSLHGRWNAYRGESENDSDLLFIMRKEHMYQSVTNLLVFLPNEQSGEQECVFKIRGSWSKGTLCVYKGCSLIAQMKCMDVKDKFMVTINPDVDSAVVVSLFAIIQTMKNSPDKHHHDSRIGGVGNVIKAVAAVAGLICAVCQ